MNYHLSESTSTVRILIERQPIRTFDGCYIVRVDRLDLSQLSELLWNPSSGTACCAMLMQIKTRNLSS